MIKWVTEHPLMTFILFILLMMMIDNMWGNYMRFKIAKLDNKTKGE